MTKKKLIEILNGWKKISELKNEAISILELRVLELESDLDDKHHRIIHIESDLSHARSYARDLSRELQEIKIELSNEKLKNVRLKKQSARRAISLEEELRLERLIMIGKAIKKMSRWQRIFWAVTGHHKYMTYQYWENRKCLKS